MPQYATEMLPVLHLPCKTSLRCSKCCTCHAKRAWGAPSAAFCHAKRSWGVPSAALATQNEPGGAPSAALATQKEPEMNLRCSKCCACHAKGGRAQSTSLWPGFRRPLGRCSRWFACHAKRAWSVPSAAPYAKRGGAHSHHSSPDFRGPLWMLKVLRLPHKTSLRCSRCCACHAKRAWGAPSAAPATQNKPEVLRVLRLPRKTRRRPFASLVARLPPTSMNVSKCCACHTKRAWGAPGAAPATQNEPEVLRVLRLPRKTGPRPFASLVARLPPTSMKVLHACHARSLKCSKCCACHAGRAWSAPSAAPATQNEAVPIRIICRRTSMNVLKVLRLPHKPSLRCSECCTCHAKQAWGAPSAAPATQNETHSHHSSPDFRRPLWRCSGV